MSTRIEFDFERRRPSILAEEALKKRTRDMRKENNLRVEEAQKQRVNEQQSRQQRAKSAYEAAKAMLELSERKKRESPPQNVQTTNKRRIEQIRSRSEPFLQQGEAPLREGLATVQEERQATIAGETSTIPSQVSTGVSATASPPISPSAYTHAGVTPKDAILAEYARRLQKIYKKHDTSKAADIDDVLLANAHNPHPLYLAICLQYGETPEPKIEAFESTERITVHTLEPGYESERTIPGTPIYVNTPVLSYSQVATPRATPTTPPDTVKPDRPPPQPPPTTNEEKHGNTDHAVKTDLVEG